MTEIFMCDIMTDIGKDDIDLEQLLIKAISLEEAFGKLIVIRKYTNIHIAELRDDILFAHVEVDDETNHIRHVLIGRPSETIE